MARAVADTGEGRKFVRVYLDNTYNGDALTPLEAERLADELRREARKARGGIVQKKLGDY